MPPLTAGGEYGYHRATVRRDISDLGDEEDAIPHGVSDGTAALVLLRQDDAGVSIAPVSRQKE